jgi:GntR family transcriptional regulator
MALDLHIITGSSTPIFKQLVDQVRLAVATGRLTQGQALPSVRSLAEQLLVNPNTVAKASGELVREGVIEAQHGRGVFVAECRSIYSDAERLRRLEPALDALVCESLSLGFTCEQVQEMLCRRFKKVSGQ